MPRTKLIGRRHSLIGTACLILGGCATGRSAAPGLWVIRGGALFDPHRQVWLPSRTIVIDGHRIAAVGTPEAPVDTPAGARVVDAAGKYLIPGLIDAHVHLDHVLNEVGVKGEEILPLFIAHGVTAVRNVGDQIAPQQRLARFAADHPTRSPRVYLGSPLIDGAPPFHRDIGRAITEPAEVAPFVQEMAAEGVTTLKLYVRADRRIGRAVIEEGHRRGLTVAAHLGVYTAQDAVADGIDGLEHIWSVFDYILPPGTKKSERPDVDLDTPAARDLISALARKSIFVDPTLVVFRNMIYLNDLPEVYAHPDNALVPKRLLKSWHDSRTHARLGPDTREARRREIRKYQELTGLLYRAGVPLLVGTDAPEPYVVPGASLHQEMELMVESGVPPAAVLAAATLGNARALKQENLIGSLEAGKEADIVILDHDPLADIRRTRSIHAVIRSGRICPSR